MSNSLNKKYDWDSHLPKMISLYFTDMSIPDICKAIQDEETGFTPKVRMVYNKLKSEGYPTDKNQRAEKAFQLARQHGLAASGSSSGIPPILPTFSDHTNDGYDVAFHPPTSWPMTLVAPQALVITGEGTPSIVEHAHTSDVPFVGEHSKALNAENHSEFPEISNYQAIDATSDTSPYWTAELAQRQSSFAADPSTFLGVIGSPLVVSTESTTFDNQEWFNDGTLSGYDQQLQNSHPWEQEELASHQDYGSTAAMEDHNTPQLPLLTDATDGVGEDNLGEMAMIPERPSTSAETQLDGIPATSSDDHNTSTYSGGNDVLMNTFSASVDVTSDDGRIQTGKQSSCCSRNTPSPIDNPTFGGRMVSWVNPKVRHLFNRSSSPEKRDSGYASGRNSPLTPVVENARPHPSSLLEFKGLYRVSCQQLHEPPAIDPFYIPASRTMERFKETPTCSQCLYSSIHNLSWSASARYLKLEVFKADLKLDSKYDITALDKAGNSALHYAASGGAGFEHFLALIQAGANPYQINTAGQLFLHCLRPHIREIGSEGFDDNLVAVFHADLVNLLNFFQPKGAFRWRDNEGRTVLDALASNIKDTEMRTRTFRHIQDAGYPLEVSSQFPMRKSSKSQPNDPSITNVDFGVTQNRQQKAYDILGRASMEPSYIDPDTGDNVLHALARLKPTEKGSLLSKIHEFVLKDIDLNLHNRNRDSPLTAFISERPFFGKHNDETGATMSKYLDALLWNDARYRIPNRINVNMRNREGATALYYAATRARPDSVRSLIEAGANVNARLGVDGRGVSILQATVNAKAQAVLDKDEIKINHFENVISYLEHENAVAEPSLCEERAVCDNSVRIMPNVEMK